MKTLAFIDVQNLFYGMQRITGSSLARMDYLKLRDAISTSQEDVLLAYVITLLDREGGAPVRSDFAFVHTLEKFGFLIRRRYTQVSDSIEGLESLRSGNPNPETVTLPDKEILKDAIRWIPSCDRVVIVSGAGYFIPVAERAREQGKPVVVYSCLRSLDLSSGLKELATEVVEIDTSFRYVPKKPEK